MVHHAHLHMRLVTVHLLHLEVLRNLLLALAFDLLNVLLLELLVLILLEHLLVELRVDALLLQDLD
jgi:hypothetical protein